MEARGWLDAFRLVHGAKREYTWYSHRNNGFRLDQAFVSPELSGQIGATYHKWGQDRDYSNRRDALSDHAALLLKLGN